MVTEKHSDPRWLHRPPKLRPIAAVMIGFICIPAGMMIQGSIGGALVGAGIGSLLMGLWDTFRLKVGMVHKPCKEAPDRLNGS